MPGDDVPDVPDVAAGHGSATYNGWRVWCPEVGEDFTRWGWRGNEHPKDVAKLVMEEINRGAMSDLDIGSDGIAVVTIGLFEFEHSLCVDLGNRIVRVRALTLCGPGHSCERFHL